MTDPDINFMSSIKQLKTDELPILARIVPHTFFYGWVIAIAIGVQMIFVQGIGYYALSVFMFTFINLFLISCATTYGPASENFTGGYEDQLTGKNTAIVR